MMQKAILCVCAAVMGAGAAFGGLISEDPGELTVAGQYWFPGDGDFDLFESGFGAAVGYREWFAFPWGVGLNLGVSQWQVDNASDAYKYTKLRDYDGDATLIPLGVSLFFNVIDWDNWNLILETGLQYALVDSNVSFYNSEEGTQREQDVDIDDAVLWTLGLEYEYMVAENLYVLGGLGYQVDVVRADTEYPGGGLRDTSFRGASLRLGAKFLF